MEPAAVHAFQEIVWGYYRMYGRHDLPWRQPAGDGTYNPYHIVVSELMLQQTQVSRVIPKFEVFIRQFPTWGDLAAASLADVIRAWSGLGYNRRAKFLWQTAQAVTEHYDGVLPQSVKELAALPGIGPNTAGAILAYAFNQPVLFIETNIRTVFIHHFFADQESVADKDLVPYIQGTVPADEVREWYWALMDYGTHLKQTVGNVSRASASYAKQSAFVGSRRQIRGQVLRLLGERMRTSSELSQLITDERLPAVLDDLVNEGFVTANQQHYHLGA